MGILPKPATAGHRRPTVGFRAEEVFAQQGHIADAAVIGGSFAIGPANIDVVDPVIDKGNYDIHLHILGGAIGKLDRHVESMKIAPGGHRRQF